MGSDAVALVKNLHRGRGGTDFHDLLHQSVGHAVKVPIESNVVIDVNRGTRPLAQVEALPWQREQSRFLQAVKQTCPRSIPLAERTLVQTHQQLADRLIEVP